MPIVIKANIKNLKFTFMKEYMLIFRHEDGQKIASPEQIQVWMKQTMDWIGGIAAQNKYVGGTGLPFDEARVVHHGNVVTNGPFGDIKETLAGYIIVRAESIDEAAEFAKGSPVLQGEGNTVEVRLMASETVPTDNNLAWSRRNSYHISSGQSTAE